MYFVINDIESARKEFTERDVDFIQRMAKRAKRHGWMICVIGFEDHNGIVRFATIRKMTPEVAYQYSQAGGTWTYYDPERFM